MRRRSAAIGEDELLTAAMRIMLDRGLHAVTPETVAAFLGVPVAHLLRLQPRFQKFVADVLRRVVATELAEVKRAVLVHPAPRDQLRALVVLLAEPVHEDVTAAWVEAFSIGRRDPDIAAVVRIEQDAWLRFVDGVLRRGVRSGDWATLQPERVAAHLLAMIDGINSYALVDYDAGVPRRAMLESIVEHGLGVQIAPVEHDLGLSVPTPR